VEKDNIKVEITEMKWDGYTETFGSRYVPGVMYCERVAVLAKLGGVTEFQEKPCAMEMSLVTRGD